MEPNELIVCRDASLGYEGQSVLAHLDLTIRAGDYLCIVGDNGSGKSTLLRGLLGLLSPQSGEILRAPELRQGAVGYLPQQTRAQRDFPATVYEVVLSGCLNQKGLRFFYTAAQKSAALMNMGKLGILELKDQSYRDLSGGQQQRVLLARALCQQPEVIVLDEPTSYLDIRHKIELLDILREMTASRGLSVVLSLHEVDLATKLADVVVLVKDNAIFRCGAPEDVLDDDTIRQLYDIHDGSFNLLLGSVELCGAAGEPRVFVVPGEGRGAPCFRALQKRGLPFATGILQRCDVDWAVAETLAARRYEAESFSPPAPDTLRAAVAAACSSACVVDSGAAIGPYNRENLELLRAAAGAGVPVLTLRMERLESLEAARPFDTVRALMDEAARLAAGKGGGVCPSSGAASGAIAGTV